MHVLKVRNVHEALPEALNLLQREGRQRLSRNGPVLYVPEPVTTVYRKPQERVLFWEERNANPFFHFFEGLWMLAGRDDVGVLAQFVKSISDYSDDGERFHGAYGYRWRRFFGADQLKQIANTLIQDKENRRQ